MAQAPASKRLAGKIPASPVVVVTAATAEIKAGTQVVSYAHRGQRYRVLKTSGSWYLVEYVVNSATRKGWILRDNVRVEIFAGTKAGQAWSGNGLTMKFCWCPAGRFTMGSPKNEKYRDDDEDQVSVTLSRGFWLGKYEVTQGEWEKLMKTTPWAGKTYVKEGGDYAASYISWEDAVKFCVTLTKQDRLSGKLPAGWSYRLPTEAQWEYACRAGTRTRYSFGDDASGLGDYGWYGAFSDGNAKNEQYAHRVGVKVANAWGFHDLHGNVWEWCRDWYKKNLPGGTDPEVTTKAARRVRRGGGWGFAARYCRSALRRRLGPVSRRITLGFRLAAVQLSSK